LPGINLLRTQLEKERLEKEMAELMDQMQEREKHCGHLEAQVKSRLILDE
jgi:hypothetical protein